MPQQTNPKERTTHTRNSVLNEVLKTSPRIRQTSPFTIDALESANSKIWWAHAYKDFVNMNLKSDSRPEKLGT